MEESRFVCKLCNKRYPCGKSLGGHMRSHVVANSAESESKFDPSLKKISYGGQEGKLPESGYGLRENPKKTWRAVDSRLPSSQERICKQCGKVFQSMKALCGHMACHSDRDKASLKDDQSWTSESNQKLVLDSYSDTDEAEERRMRTRALTNRRNKKVVDQSPANGSSSASEIDEQDQEEVAMCLMLLSMDNGSKCGGNSVGESSDNNSVVLETKGSSVETRIGKEGIQDEAPQMKKIEVEKLKDSYLEHEVALAENSDSAYFLEECSKAEDSDVSVEGLRRYGSFRECKKPMMSAGWGGDEYSIAEVTRSLEQIKRCVTQSSKLSKDSEYDEVDIASLFAGTESRKRKYASEIPESEVCKKKSKYECFNCKKIFKSYQALGGHRPCHKRTNTFYESRYDSSDNSMDDSTDYQTTGKLIESSSNKKYNAKNSSFYAEKKVKPKNSKGHVCPFCNRVFKNGQALGGHKRSHFISGHEETSNRTAVVKPQPPNLLDLNLPAPEVDENYGHGDFS